MMFNLGRPRLSKFKNMKKALDKGDWMLAAAEGEESSSAWRPAIHRAGLSEGSTSASSQRRRVSMHTQDTPGAHAIDP